MRRALIVFLWIGWVGLVLIQVLGWMFNKVWWGDLLLQFQLQYAIIGLGLLVGSLSLRIKFLSIGYAIVLLLLWYPMVGLFVPVGESNQLPHQLKIISVNCLSSNTNYDALQMYLEESNPDVVVLLEVSPDLEAYLKTTLVGFPYQLVNARGDNFGIAMLSKVPFDSVEEILIGQANLPSIAARIVEKTDTVQILATHPLPPISPTYFALRNEQLFALAAYRNQKNGEFILIGDLNTTSFSPIFKELTSSAFLKDTRLGSGWNCTWPANTFIPFLTLDHCLVSKGIQVKESSVGPSIGSDHLPIEVTLRFGTAIK